jgi:hypothetical protein
MLLLFVVMNDQPLLTILEMGGEILEKGFSDNMDQIDNDLAEFAVVTIVCDDRVTSHSQLLWR